MKLLKTVSCFLFTALFCFSTPNLLAKSNSQIPYYFTTESYRNDLKSAMSQNQKVLGYKRAREVMFGNIDLKVTPEGQYYIEDVYCQKKFNNTSGVGPGKIPNHNKINCEHTWPQSRFSRNHSSSAQKSDLHHLFPTDSRANSTRRNSPFAVVDGEVLSGCVVSSYGQDERSGIASFEPPDEHKGNVARALFYFSVRYDLPISAEEEFHLRIWHEIDPIDDEERQRHEKIFQEQGNRNPFIDDPTLVDSIANF